MRLAIALERAVSFKDLTSHPILADQANLIERRLGKRIPSHSFAVPAGHCAPAAVSANRRSERNAQ